MTFKQQVIPDFTYLVHLQLFNHSIRKTYFNFQTTSKQNKIKKINPINYILLGSISEESCVKDVNE